MTCPHTSLYPVEPWTPIVWRRVYLQATAHPHVIFSAVSSTDGGAAEISGWRAPNLTRKYVRIMQT